MILFCGSLSYCKGTQKHASSSPPFITTKMFTVTAKYLLRGKIFHNGEPLLKNVYPPFPCPLPRPSALAPSIQYRASNLNLSQLLPLTLSLQRALITSARPLSLLQSSSLTIFCQYYPSFENGLIFGLAEPHTILFFFFSHTLNILYLFLFLVFPASPAHLTIRIIVQNSI